MNKKWSSHTLRYYALVVVSYIVLSLLIPLSRDTREAYNLSLVQAHIIAFISVLPLFGIWFAAFYCYSRLQRYAASIIKSREGKAMKKIADGVTILSWGLIAQAFIALMLSGVATNQGSFHTAAVIVQNYLTLCFPLLALPLIGTGTRQLVEIKRYRLTLRSVRVLFIVFAVIGTFYSYLILHLKHAANNPYDLPTYLQLATIIVPYLYAWFSGLLAALEINVYAKNTDGLLYKYALNFVSSGLIVLIIASIAMQYLNSAFFSNLGDFSLSAVLLIDYLLLAAIAAGYILMISGARRLQKIEEV